MVKKALKRTLLCTLLVFLVLMLNACGDGTDIESDTGGGQTEPDEPRPQVVGPDLNGDDWKGYYKSVQGHYVALTASIDHVGNEVTIQTSKQSGVASTLVGKINSVGQMTMYDLYDNQDWTTLYGPASTNSINLADFVFVEFSKIDTNILILKR